MKLMFHFLRRLIFIKTQVLDIKLVEQLESSQSKHGFSDSGNQKKKLYLHDLNKQLKSLLESFL